ncbi:dihydrofolate reductase, putative [Talaromyces stipitatus ATCC 10500]|uniref:Dihydrofolate reductase n=1 Tax=Talaromyces stipitatus (strain ATCC 10500 / CBS 375.48 / QM 6759 / NRRL 1006) TaxID=441959 RepID=B8M2L8_TALSN|nr:dihydrofolate reductase, putative [Talaromyces stipitatus ATCC 10500]EED21929.1 dihydrofolate reductase, putative [Talaromyces stipitatus ATCC 10500]
MSLPPSSDPDSLQMKTPLTLVVATTPITRPPGSSKKPILGIGLNGTLPWPRIKSDMNFFARVTSRPPSSGDGSGSGNGKEKINAIIMGRKTYYSLPKGLRPLKDRLNVIISRDEHGTVSTEIHQDLTRQKEKSRTDGKEDKRDAFVAHSFDSALTQLFDKHRRQDLGYVYVIGGGEIYKSSLELEVSLSSKIVQRILMTRIKRRDGEKYECDTFFPLTDEDLSTSTGGEKGWRRVGVEEVEGWVGESVKEDWTEEGEVAFKIEGYADIYILFDASKQNAMARMRT